MISDFDFKGSLINDWIAASSDEDIKNLVGKEVSDSNRLWIIKDINHTDIYLAELNDKYIELPPKKFPIKFLGIHFDRLLYIPKTERNLLNKINKFLGIQDNSSELIKKGLYNLYYMAHLEYLESFLKNGILSKRKIIEDKVPFKDISDHDVQNIRHNKLDSIYHRAIHDYVPLYYLPKTPMLYSRREIQSKLLFFVINIQKLLLNTHHIFSDGNAAGHETAFSKNIPDDQEIYDLIKSGNWTNNWVPDKVKKRKIQMEVLVYPKVELDFIDKIICFDDVVLNEIKNKFPLLNIPVLVDKSFYF